MAEYFASHPYVVAILVALALLTAFVCVKAAQASAKRHAENEKIINKLKEDNRLRNKFAVLTRQLIDSSEPTELFKGVALNLDRQIADAENMEQAFAALNQEQREIYALCYVAEDGRERLSDFFAANGSPLTDTALEAVKKLLPAAAVPFGKEFLAFDGNDETTSFVQSDIEQWDLDFAAVIAAAPIEQVGGAYIAANADKFI